MRSKGFSAAVDRTLSDSNYANVFPLWDIVFDTYSDPDRHAPGAVGMRDDSTPDGFLAQFLAPFTWQRLVKETGRPD